MRERDVGSDPVADLDPDVQLLLTFSYEGVEIGFTRFDLAAWKLPSTRDLRRLRPLASQNATVDNDCRADNDQGGRTLSLHEAQGCQILIRSAARPTQLVSDLALTWTPAKEKVTLGSRP